MMVVHPDINALEKDNLKQQIRHFIKSLKEKEDNFFLIQKEVLSLRETVKIKENEMVRLTQELETAREEMRAKDNHITALNEKLKLARSNQAPSATTGLAKNLADPDIQRLKDSNSAHQQQNSLLMHDIERIKRENEIQLQAKNSTIKILERDLEEARGDFQSLREKILLKESTPSENNAEETQNIQKELFFSIAKYLTNSASEKNLNLDLNALWEEAKNVPYQNYSNWLNIQIENAHSSIKQSVKQSVEQSIEQSKPSDDNGDSKKES